jgi:hypothetical protein
MGEDRGPPGTRGVFCLGTNCYPFRLEQDDDSVPKRQEEDGGPERCNLKRGSYPNPEAHSRRAAPKLVELEKNNAKVRQ